MSQPPVCPKCGAQLPGDAPAGLCPKCLVQAGFESDGQAQPQLEPTGPSPASSGFEPPSVEELARRFPQLEVLELLGKGGMGAVYKARQRELDRLVAVKILPPQIARDPAFAERFAREARALARLSHPNIVAVYDFGRTSPLPSPSGRGAGGEGAWGEGARGEAAVGEGPPLFYFIMEYVDGVNLRQAIRSGGVSPKEALAIVPQICEALQFAHDEGIVHRDIKPENILVDKKGRVKIADFGLAKLLGHAPGDVSLTGTQQVMGTLRYMAPEQIEGTKAVDHRADIYSLGVVFYELLTGELPIGRFAPPSKKVQIDVRLDEVVLRALEKEPEQRYQHVSELKTDVESIAVPVERAPREARAAESLESSGERKPMAGRSVIEAVGDSLMLVAGIALVTALGVAGWLSLTQDPQAAGATNWQRLVRPQLVQIAATVAAYALLILAAGIQMRRLRGRLYALLCNVIVGLFLPAVLALNVIMEHDVLRHIWLVLVPVWSGMPVCVWAVAVLYRKDVRAAFEDARHERRQRKREAPEGAVPPADQVKGPATGLLVAGALAVAAPWILVPALAVYFGVPVLYFGSLVIKSGQAHLFTVLEAVKWWGVVTYPLGVLMILGALSLRQLQSRWLALTGAVVAVLPWSPAWLLGLPMGIWSLVVQNKRDVEKAFDAQAADSEALGQRIGRLGTGLFIMGVLGALPAALALILALVGVGLALAGTVRVVGFPPQAAVLILSLVPSILLLIAGRKTAARRSYGWAITGSLVAVLPLSIAWPVSLPIGIWALALLTRRDAKAAFAAEASRPDKPRGLGGPPAPPEAPESKEDRQDAGTPPPVLRAAVSGGSRVRLWATVFVWTAVVVGACVYLLPRVMMEWWPWAYDERWETGLKPQSGAYPKITLSGERRLYCWGQCGADPSRLISRKPWIATAKIHGTDSGTSATLSLDAFREQWSWTTPAGEVRHSQDEVRPEFVLQCMKDAGIDVGKPGAREEAAALVGLLKDAANGVLPGDRRPRDYHVGHDARIGPFAYDAMGGWGYHPLGMVGLPLDMDRNQVARRWIAAVVFLAIWLPGLLVLARRRRRRLAAVAVREKGPEQRYQHVGEVRTDVERIRQSGAPAVAAAAPESPPVLPPAVALPQMLGVAMGLVLGMLSATVGVLLVPAALMFSEAGSGPFWGWMGGAFGCLFGGLGALAGSWNTYRTIRGECDWMKIPGWTALDYSLAGYGVLGAVSLVLGILAKAGVLGPLETDVARNTFLGLSLLGGLMLFQAALFLLYRAPWRLAGPRSPH